MKTFKGTDKILNIEIKELDPDVNKIIIDMFAAHQMLPQLFLSSFCHYHRKVAVEYCESKGYPVAPFGFLTYSPYEILKDNFLSLTRPGDKVTLSYGSVMVHMDYMPTVIKQAEEKGVRVNIWFDGVDSKEHETLKTYKKLRDLGIETIITNHPSIALEHNKVLIKTAAEETK